MQPLLGLSIIVGFWAITPKKFKQKLFYSSSIRQSLPVILLIIGFLMQPYIVTLTLQLFQCQNLGAEGNSEYFLENDPQISCTGGFHMGFILMVGIPALFVWGVLLPVFLYKKLRNNRTNLDDPAI